MIHRQTIAADQKEYVAELLKERIYATLALLAVLASIDVSHSTPLKAALLTTGTIVSLWAASIVATKMSRRVIYQDDPNGRIDHHHLARKHAPMLAVLIFPLLLIGIAALNIIPLSLAINISLASSLLLLVGWSFLSARSIKMVRLPLILMMLIELGIGLAVVGLKVAVGH